MAGRPVPSNTARVACQLRRPRQGGPPGLRHGPAWQGMAKAWPAVFCQGHRQEIGPGPLTRAARDDNQAFPSRPLPTRLAASFAASGPPGLRHSRSCRARFVRHCPASVAAWQPRHIRSPHARAHDCPGLASAAPALLYGPAPPGLGLCCTSSLIRASPATLPVVRMARPSRSRPLPPSPPYPSRLGFCCASQPVRVVAKPARVPPCLSACCPA